ncbi:MAG: metallophosphoesterase [Gammaproteobacteria bacterium]|nr:metallophosphoesterase [Gammaproteobacteria bacterium]
MFEFKNICQYAFLALFLFFPTLVVANPSSQAFLALSDIHFTPYDHCSWFHSCPLIQKLEAAPVQQWVNIFRQYDTTVPSRYGLDTNSALFNSTLNEINALPKTYHFAIITGDFLAHAYRLKFIWFAKDLSQHDYQQFVNKTYEYLQLRLQEATSNVPVYITLGNNDSYQGDYYSDPGGSFYEIMSQRVAQMNQGLDETNFKQTFSKAAYYAIKPNANSQNRILFLNTTLFSIYANGKHIAKGAQQEFIWLNAQLESAKQGKYKVWLIDHIPNGIDAYRSTHKEKAIPLWQSQYNSAFLKLITQYPNTITAIITAHVHMDGFQFLSLSPQKQLLDTFIPSISPIYGNNPAFKVYEYNPDSMELSNFQTYYLNESTDKWTLEYDFNSTYQPNCDKCEISTAYSMITSSGWRTDKYKRYYAVSTNSQAITKNGWLPYYWCATQYQTKREYTDCSR